VMGEALLLPVAIDRSDSPPSEIPIVLGCRLGPAGRGQARSDGIAPLLGKGRLGNLDRERIGWIGILVEGGAEVAETVDDDVEVPALVVSEDQVRLSVGPDFLEDSTLVVEDPAPLSSIGIFDADEGAVLLVGIGPDAAIRLGDDGPGALRLVAERDP